MTSEGGPASAGPRGWPRAFASTEPPAPAISPRVLREEIVVVLALSLLASAVDAIIDLLSAPIAGVTTTVFPQVGFATQLADIFFALVPVWLVFHLLRRDGEGPETIGITGERPMQDLIRGIALAVIVGAAGIGLYLGAVALGINRFVVPVPPLGHWWTIPVLVLGSLEAALLEEVVVTGYLITRLRQLKWRAWSAVAASALLRATYHLYQGWGGFAGNLALGLFFGWFFVRRGRLWPLVVAHFLLDVGAGVGYLLFRSHLPGVA